MSCFGATIFPHLGCAACRLCLLVESVQALAGHWREKEYGLLLRYDSVCVDKTSDHYALRRIMKTQSMSERLRKSWIMRGKSLHFDVYLTSGLVLIHMFCIAEINRIIVNDLGSSEPMCLPFVMACVLSTSFVSRHLINILCVLVSSIFRVYFVHLAIVALLPSLRTPTSKLTSIVLLFVQGFRHL
jgi:hypothetical protein